MKIVVASETSTREEHDNYMSQLRQCGCDWMHCVAYQLVSSAIQVMSGEVLHNCTTRCIF